MIKFQSEAVQSNRHGQIKADPQAINRYKSTWIKQTLTRNKKAQTKASVLVLTLFTPFELNDKPKGLGLRNSYFTN